MNALGIIANGTAVVPNTIVTDVLRSDAYLTVADAVWLLLHPRPPWPASGS